jgi:hypothetical protein
MNTGYNHRVSPFRTEFCISGGFPYIKQCTKIEADVIEEAHAWLSDGVTGTERRWKLSPGFDTASALLRHWCRRVRRHSSRSFSHLGSRLLAHCAGDVSCRCALQLQLHGD